MNWWQVAIAAEISSPRCTQVCVESKTKSWTILQSKSSLIKCRIRSAGAARDTKIENASNLTESRRDGHKLIKSWKEATYEPAISDGESDEAIRGDWKKFNSRQCLQKYKIECFSPVTCVTSRCAAARYFHIRIQLLFCFDSFWHCSVVFWLFVVLDSIEKKR